MVTAVPPKSTCDPATKLLPEIVSVYAPAAKLVGLTLLSVGAGFSNVTLLLPLAFSSVVAVPRIVIELGLGSVAGATYFPVASIVPTEAVPPTVPFTDHFTVWFVLPETKAVKICEDPARILAVPGTTLTETAAANEVEVDPSPKRRSVPVRPVLQPLIPSGPNEPPRQRF